MGLGNTREQGNNKSNFNWQKRMLQLLGIISTNTASGSFPVPVVRTPSILVTSGAASVAAGARSVTIWNNGGADGTVMGQTFRRGAAMTWSAGGQADTLGAIAYSAAGTEFTITTVV